MNRQIRNAFQTAIALVEYEARQSRAKKPTLGKKQFRIVAKASAEFDEYLQRTLKGPDSDIAFREGMRYDEFGRSENAPKQKSTISKVKLRTGRWTDSESSEENISEESEDDNDEEESDEGQTPNIGKRTGSAASDTHIADLSKDEEDGDEDDDEKTYKEFLKFKEMQKKAKK